MKHRQHREQAHVLLAIPGTDAGVALKRIGLVSDSSDLHAIPGIDAGVALKPEGLRLWLRRGRPSPASMPGSR